MKITAKDLLAILRRFNLADNENVPREIDQQKITHPSPHNTLASFRFGRERFFVLFDDTAEDDGQYIESQLNTASLGIAGQLIANPNDSTTTWALPFKGKDVYLFHADTGKQRLDIHLATLYPEASRSTWQKHIKTGRIKVNGAVETAPKSEVSDTDRIAIDLPQRESTDDKTLPILYIDDDVIVINKPAGVLTHAKGAIAGEFTVADFFRRYSTYKLDTNRPGIIHRLDRDTSGVLIGARHDAAAKALQKQFADRKAKKSYVAILSGTPKDQAALIDLPIGRNPSAPSTFRIDPKGKPARTIYKVLDANDNHSLVKLSPETGRTHQLRVHMAYIGTPILGDRVYGKPANRMYLHAHELEITTPDSERRTFTAELPAEFDEQFSNARELV